MDFNTDGQDFLAVENALNKLEKNYISTEVHIKSDEEEEEVQEVISVDKEPWNQPDPKVSKAQDGPPLSERISRENGKNIELEGKKKHKTSHLDTEEILIENEGDVNSDNSDHFKGAKKHKASIMDEDDIQRIAEKIQKAKKSNPPSYSPQNVEDVAQFTNQGHHQRHAEINIIDSHDDDLIQQEEDSDINYREDQDTNSRYNLTKPEQISNRPFSFDEEGKREDAMMPNHGYSDSRDLNDNSADYDTFMPSKPHIVVNDQNDESQVPNQMMSPKFEIDNRDLNARDQQFEDLKINKVLVENIDNLEAELAKTHKRITYLEEYNTQLSKSKNDLYHEKEELIKRSIEYDYIKQRLDEKERRLAEIERENARRTTEIQGLKKDNSNCRAQMDSMLQFIKKLATNRASQQNTEEATQSNDDLVEAINVFSDRLKSVSSDRIEEINTPGFVLLDTEVKRSMNNTVPIELVEEDDGHYMTDSSPCQKIIKRRYKVPSSNMKPHFSILDKQQSPLDREQIKLLHDPQSFEKYTREFDISVGRSQSSKKKVIPK